MIRNEDCQFCVVHLPMQMLYAVHGAEIIGFCKASDFNAKFGPHALSKTAEIRGWAKFTYLTFTGSTRVPPLQTEDISGASVEISSGGLFNIITGWAATERGAILPDDLKLLFEPYAQSLRNAEDWTLEVLPHLLRGTSHEVQPLGSYARYAINAEREGHMAATWTLLANLMTRSEESTH